MAYFVTYIHTYRSEQPNDEYDLAIKDIDMFLRTENVDGDKTRRTTIGNRVSWYCLILYGIV